MTPIVDRLIVARDRLRPLRRAGVESIRNPAVEATDAMADAANTLIELYSTLKSISVRARSDGQRTFDDCIRDLERIDDVCRGALK